MSVKMPVLGQPARRKSSGLGWVLFLGLAVAAGGYLWYGRHRPAPPPPVAQVPVVAPSPVITAPGSTAVPGLAQAPVASPVPTGPRSLSVRIDGPRLSADAWGEKTEAMRHRPAVEVKGATYTTLRVAQESDGTWVAQTVVDV